MSGDTNPGGCQVLQRLQLRPVLPQNKAMVFLWNAYLHMGLRGGGWGEWEGQVRLIHVIDPSLPAGCFWRVLHLSIVQMHPVSVS